MNTGTYVVTQLIKLLPNEAFDWIVKNYNGKKLKPKNIKNDSINLGYNKIILFMNTISSINYNELYIVKHICSIKKILFQ